MIEYHIMFFDYEKRWILSLLSDKNVELLVLGEGDLD